MLVAGCASKSTAWRPCWVGTLALAQLAQSPAARPSTISSSPSIWPMPWGRCCEAGERMDRVADGAPGCPGVRLQIPPAVQAALQSHFDGEPEALQPRSRHRRCSERRAQPGAQSKRPALARCVEVHRERAENASASVAHGVGTSQYWAGPCRPGPDLNPSVWRAMAAASWAALSCRSSAIGD